MTEAARKRVGVLISGRGSNLQALLDACAEATFPAEIVLVVSDKAEAPGLARAARAGVATRIVARRDYPDRAACDAAMTAALEAAGVELVCLAGFMRLLSEAFVDHWRDRMINICTVHFVRFEMDSGPIIGQAAVPVLPGDDAESLAARVLEAEHRLYPHCLRLVAEGRIEIRGETAATPGIDPGARLINPAP
jgi:phosphoribosylglycinamide formyltransferase-1